ncbi:MAG: HNH endonuclease signature motif containing protein [Myxococcota bacterium]
MTAYEATDPREQRRLARRRDRGCCAICGLDTRALKRQTRGRRMWAKLRERGFARRRSLWELDHIVPLIDGGSHDPSNLQTLCVPCHRSKSAEESRERALRQRENGQRAPSRGLSPGTTPSGRKDSDTLDGELDRLLACVDEANARVARALEPGALEPQDPPKTSRREAAVSSAQPSAVAPNPRPPR